MFRGVVSDCCRPAVHSTPAGSAQISYDCHFPIFIHFRCNNTRVLDTACFLQSMHGVLGGSGPICKADFLKIDIVQLSAL